MPLSIRAILLFLSLALGACGAGVLSVDRDSGTAGFDGGASDAGRDGGRQDAGAGDSGMGDGGPDAGPDGGAGPTRYEDRSAKFPETALSTTDALLFDADGDGDDDIVFISQTDSNGNEGGVELLLRDGATLTPAPMPVTGSWTFGRAGDLDRDGDQDIVLTRPARTTAQFAVLTNDGAGTFTFDESTVPLISGASHGYVFGRPVLLDITGDAAPEVLLPISFSLDFTDDMPSVLLMNDGFGTFAIDTSGRLPAIPDMEDWTICAAAGDVDGDGDVDLYLGESERQQRLLINAGGTFADESLDDGAGTPRMPPDAIRAYHCEFGDLDGDGDLDLLVVTDGTVTQGGMPVATESAIFENDGVGHFALTVLASSSGPKDGRGLTLVDADGDGRMDILQSNSRDPLDHGGAGVEIFLGQGGLRFEPLVTVPVVGEGVYAVVATDLDGDGWSDLALAVTQEDPAVGGLKNRLLMSAP